MESEQDRKERRREIAKALLDLAKVTFGVVVLGHLLRIVEGDISLGRFLAIVVGVIAMFFLFLIANLLMKHYRK
jgi:di/tricarboxylate transporter